MIRRMRKNVMRAGTVESEHWISHDDWGRKYTKRDRGYIINAVINGYKVRSVDRNPYDAWKGCVECMKAVEVMGTWTPPEEGCEAGIAIVDSASIASGLDVGW